MAINFPNSPLAGQVYEYGDYKYTYDGVKWTSVIKYSSDSVKAHSSLAEIVADTKIKNGDWVKDLNTLAEYSVGVTGDIPLTNGLFITEIGLSDFKKSEVVIKINSVFDLEFANLKEGDAVELIGYHDGTAVGGGPGVIALAKHNAITAFSLSKVFPSTNSQAQLTEWFTPDSELTLCLVRKDVQEIKGEMAGITGDLSNGWVDDFIAVQACSNLATSLLTYTELPKGDIFLSGDGLAKNYIETKSSIIGQGIGITRVQWSDLGSVDLSFEIVNGAAEYVTIGGMTIDNACSDDPETWDSSNYDSFTGRRGIRSLGTRVHEIFINLDIYNTVQAGLAWYGGAEAPFVSNVHSTRNRGNFGDCFYVSGRKIGAKFSNISGTDFTRIGFVTDSPSGGFIKNAVVENASFEYGHDQSFNYGGGEFNSGAWSENTLGISYIDCSTKNTGGRGFTGTTGGSTLGDSGDTFAVFNYTRCSTDDCDIGFVNSTLGGVSAIHNLVNCTNENNVVDDFTGTSRSENLTVNITRSVSKKVFNGNSQARVFGYSAETGYTANINIDTAHIESDFDPLIFDVAESKGHFGVYSGVGVVNYSIDNVVDKNGIAFNVKTGDRGDTSINECSPVFLYSARALTMTVKNTDVSLLDSKGSGMEITDLFNLKATGHFVSISNFNSFNNVEFHVPDNNRVWLSNNNAVANNTNKIANSFTECKVYKNFQGSEPYAIQISSKSAPYSNYNKFNNSEIYNTNSDGAGGYALYGDNGFGSGILGEILLDTTVQYAIRSFTTDMVNTSGITRLALQ